MSKSNYYNGRSRYGPKRKMREILPTEEMKHLLPISKIRINPERDMLSIYNGDKKRPIRANYNIEDAPATVKGLVQKLVHEFKYKERIALEWSNHLSDLLRQCEEEDLEDEDGDQENQRKIVCLHKYPTDIPLAEAILVGNKPMFLQIIDGKMKTV
jgi:hypothetical protein